MILSMKRYALDTLKQWKNESNRKPLVIRSARQVGKDDILNVIRYIEIDSNMKISPGKTLLFLDEIQAAPSVLSKTRGM